MPRPLTLSLGRRAFLGGLLTLAVAPALAMPQPGLTPLETALEELRHAHLMSYLDHTQGAMPTLKAVQNLRDLGLPRSDFALYCRLAFGMARRDVILIKGRERPRRQRRIGPNEDFAAMLQRRFGIEGGIEESMRALPWPRGWAGEQPPLSHKASLPA